MTAHPSKQRRIALFGGTFDPVHDGHLFLASTARDALALDEVRFIPCRISPHKKGTRPAAAEDRLEMLRRATRNLPWATVDAIEVERGGTSYSYQTAEEISQKFPDTRLFWILGTDQWRVLPQWAFPKRLAARVEFIVFERGEQVAARAGYRMHRLPGIHPASATEIRHAIAAESPPLWLHPQVAEWIHQKKLYQQEC